MKKTLSYALAFGTLALSVAGFAARSEAASALEYGLIAAGYTSTVTADRKVVLRAPASADDVIFFTIVDAAGQRQEISAPGSSLSIRDNGDGTYTAAMERLSTGKRINSVKDDGGAGQ